MAEQMLSNPPEGAWVIQKFGGTSVGKSAERIAGEIVPKYIRGGNRVALVCSARSGHTKATGTTNLLLRAALEAIRPRAPDLSSVAPSLRTSPAGSPAPSRPQTPRSGFLSGSSRRATSAGGGIAALSKANGTSSSVSSLTNAAAAATIGGGADGAAEDDRQLFDETIDQIKRDHIEAARKIVRNSPEVLQEVEEDLEYDCERLRGFLRAAQIIEEISTRSKDTIMGVGERLACRIITAALRDRGVDAELVSLDSIIDWDVFGEDPEAAAKSSDGPPQLSQAFYTRLSERLGERLADCGDRVPVITGFFGVVPGSLLAQVGRGYSDLCAALCAVGTKAAELQVWKEVDGIFTADPRKVPTARLLSTITPEEAAELTYYGSEVIHPFTMEQVIRSAIPIRIKNVENPNGEGTIIFPDAVAPAPAEADEAPAHGARDAVPPSTAPSLPASVPASVLEPHLGPTAITIKDTVVVLSVHSNRKTISHGFFARIFGTLDKHGIVVDLISTSEVHVSMAIHGEIRKSVIDRVVRDLKVVGEISISRDMAILSLVGKYMKNKVGVAGKMFSTLAEGNVNIEMISQGASEINISCVIEERDAVKALNLVHLKLLHQAPQQPLGY
ncbi:hypothetical protein JCM8202_004527 [Rhodotorula sphaerocarpa]